MISPEPSGKTRKQDPVWGDPQMMLSMPRFESTWHGIEIEVSVTADSSDDEEYVVKAWRTSSTDLEGLHNWHPALGVHPDYISTTFSGKNGLEQTYPTSQIPVLSTYYAYRSRLYKSKPGRRHLVTSTLVLETLDTYQWTEVVEGGQPVLKFKKV